MTNLSQIHVNTRGMNSNFEKVHNLYLNYLISFNLISETWSTDKDFVNNSDFHLPNFYFIHQERKTGRKKA